jgi:hypothetical protein
MAEFSDEDDPGPTGGVFRVYICFACLGDAREMITRQLMKDYRKANR